MLAPSGIVIEGNRVRDVERYRRTYAPGLHLEGCGTKVVGNWFHDMPSSAVRIEGNDHMFVSNLVERVVMESDDQGGIDIYANPTYAGNVIAFNYWKDVGGSLRMKQGRGAVRFDDAVSNMRVYANRFVNSSRPFFGAVQINGGRHNVVECNVFENCEIAVSVGNWPQDRWVAYMDRPNVRKWRTEDTPLDRMPYATRYPGIAALRETPLVNAVRDNVVFGPGMLLNDGGSRMTANDGNRLYASETSLRGETQPAAVLLAPDDGWAATMRKRLSR